MTPDTEFSIRLFLIGLGLIAASHWVGAVIGEIHAIYQLRKKGEQ